ncbi:hypothetical protein POM88_012847 [Heracleum sosnowskyi]|uniref:Uncharacterized protein n=1 Tax=Heracleum sosnowskyi TaxID=360622 RepID=A0AAD8IZT7_9APIA|nr:hypothetical protein POM88_012847 [Heracleum sosnowskyi]
MRCKKHFADCSSAIGVCASCLRERLLTIIETQIRYEAQVLLVKPQLEDEHRKSDAVQQHITFPKSGGKSDNSAACPHPPHSLSETRFYNTPQIGPNGIFMTAKSNSRESRAGNFRFSSFSNLFTSKTSKFESQPDSNFDAGAKHKKLNSTNSTMTETQQTKSTSSWFTNLFASKKKRTHIVSVTFPDEYSSYSSETTPKDTSMRATPQRRKQNQGRNVAGLSFCLSPLVRPSPNRSRNHKGVLPEMVIQSGEIKASPVRPNLSAAASFTGNRSRKLANFGRFHPGY